LRSWFMPQNFLCPQRDQPMLMPADMREWLAEDDLAFVVLDAVAALDLGEVRRRYRADGHGRAAFDPEMMVALLLYGYCQGERSSRVIEKRCARDVGYRVIAGGLYPDHATIARFRVRHEKALGGLFSQVLRLLAAEGMVSLGLLSLDGTKLAGNAAQKANRTLRHPRGREDYKLRSRTVEPVFGQLKTCQKHSTMSRRGLTACKSEWLLACTAHNLRKLHRHRAGRRRSTARSPAAATRDHPRPRPCTRLASQDPPLAHPRELRATARTMQAAGRSERAPL
jgi:transposase